MTEARKISEARDFLHVRLPDAPSVAIVLGSGLASIAAGLTDRQSISYSDIPHWPTGSVSGHKGELISGRLAEIPILLLSGRAHLYEGYSPGEVTFGVRVLGALGVKILVLTNAAGGIRDGFEPGTIALIADHINLQFASPLTGVSIDDPSSRFVDLTQAYDRNLRQIAQTSAARISLDLKQGVYAAVLGPQYETPAEIRFLRTIGADMVGMSTVMETIAARQLGMKVLAFSIITNRAAGLSDRQLSHEEVLESGATATAALSRILTLLLTEIG